MGLGFRAGSTTSAPLRHELNPPKIRTSGFSRPTLELQSSAQGSHVASFSKQPTFGGGGGGGHCTVELQALCSPSQGCKDEEPGVVGQRFERGAPSPFLLRVGPLTTWPACFRFELAIVRPGVHGHMSMVDSLHSRICLFCACGCL